MSKIFLAILLLSNIAFGIDKKTPTGGTVKDKPGQSQQQLMNVLVFSGGPFNTNTAAYTTGTGFKIPKGTWLITLKTVSYGGTGWKGYRTGLSTDAVSTTFSDLAEPDNTANIYFGNALVEAGAIFLSVPTMYRVLTSDTTYYVKGLSAGSNNTLSAWQVIATRIGNP